MRGGLFLKLFLSTSVACGENLKLYLALDLFSLLDYFLGVQLRKTSCTFPHTPSLFAAEGPLNVFFQLPVTEISEVEDHKSVRAAGLLYFGDSGVGGGVGNVGLMLV